MGPLEFRPQLRWTSDSKDESCNAINGKSYNSEQSSKPKKSVTFHLARMNMPHELSRLRLSGPVLDGGAPYSGIGFNELKLLLPYVRTNWNG